TIIDQVRQKAVELSVPSVVMIFEPQPREFFQGSEAPPRLMPLRQKFEALLAEGIDMVLCIRFDETLRSYSAMGFIQDLPTRGLGVLQLVVGDAFRFGRGRPGDFSSLKQVGQEHDFTVESARSVTVDGARLSSARVRNALNVNGPEDAERFLGHPYRIHGRVV